MIRTIPADSSSSHRKLAGNPLHRLAVALRGKWRWILAALLVLAGLLMARLYQGDMLSYERLVEQEQSVRQFIVQRPLVSFCIGFVVYTIISCIPGLTGKAILFGWLFGLWSGLVIVCLALTIAATFGFLLSRYFFQELAHRRFAFIVQRIDRSFDRQGPIYLVILRLLHVPYSPLNYALGATNVSVPTFAWTTLIGMLPGNFAFVLAGSQLPTLEGVVEAGVWSLVDFRVLAAMSAAVLIPLAARQLALRFRSSTSTHPATELDDGSRSRSQR